MSEFILAAQHEYEGPATDVVEYLVWDLVKNKGRKLGVTIKDVTDECAILQYEQVRTSLMRLAGTGRVTVRQGRNQRAMGKKMIAHYFPVDSKPRLIGV